MVLPALVCPRICISITGIMRKVLKWCSWNLVGLWTTVMRRTHQMLGLILLKTADCQPLWFRYNRLMANIPKTITDIVMTFWCRYMPTEGLLLTSTVEANSNNGRWTLGCKQLKLVGSSWK